MARTCITGEGGGPGLIRAESLEAVPGFDDSGWVVADRSASFSITPVSGGVVLFADDFGFHTGNPWYRGRFGATGKETGIRLWSDSGGGAQAFSVWLNGTFLGSATTGSANLTFPAGTVKPQADNVLSVLTVNMGHELDYNSANGNKAARGLTSAQLLGAPMRSITWRLQGVRGGENGIDQVRGPLSTGGLFGERAGWSLQGFPDGTWTPVTLPTDRAAPGVTWYRATIFVNGWQLGDYVNYLGPQRSFPTPNGILNTNGDNSFAIAVWNLDGTTGGLDRGAPTPASLPAATGRCRH